MTQVEITSAESVYPGVPIADPVETLLDLYELRLTEQAGVPDAPKAFLMSERLDPRVVFNLIAHHVPKDIHKHVLIAGSLAAAYHHREQLVDGAINTKDADVVVQPAGAVKECATIATRLLDDGWLRTVACYPRATAKPKDFATAADWLRAIRLRPRRTESFFIELLAFPQGSAESRI